MNLHLLFGQVDPFLGGGHVCISFCDKGQHKRYIFENHTVIMVEVDLPCVYTAHQDDAERGYYEVWGKKARAGKINTVIKVMYLGQVQVFNLAPGQRLSLVPKEPEQQECTDEKPPVPIVLKFNQDYPVHRHCVAPMIAPKGLPEQYGRLAAKPGELKMHDLPMKIVPSFDKRKRKRIASSDSLPPH